MGVYISDKDRRSDMYLTDCRKREQAKVGSQAAPRVVQVTQYISSMKYIPMGINGQIEAPSGHGVHIPSLEEDIHG